MRMRNRFFWINLLVFSFFIIWFLSSLSFGQVYDNIGFIKDVPEEIKKACPMCDEFLDVKWIDEERYIGKLRTEWYKDGKKQGILYLLVKLEEPGSEEMLRRGNGVFYEITEKEYFSKDFEKYIRSSKYFYDKGYFFMTIVDKNKKIRLSQSIIPSEYSMQSLGNFSNTICIIYPNLEYLFIAEVKKPFVNNDLNEEYIYNLILKFAKERCSQIGKRCNLENIKYTDSIDINYDGLKDYVFRFNLLDNNVKFAYEYILFSEKNKYYFKELQHCYVGKYYMPTYYAKIKKQRIVYYVTCNLTELGKGGR